MKVKGNIIILKKISVNYCKGFTFKPTSFEEKKHRINAFSFCLKKIHNNLLVFNFILNIPGTHKIIKKSIYKILNFRGSCHQQKNVFIKIALKQPIK